MRSSSCLRRESSASPWRWGAIIGALLLAAGLLAGCGTLAFKLAYNQGPTLLYWWLDGYVDFDDAQGPRAKELIGQWFRGHRAEQLPQYLPLLQRAQAEVQQPVLTPQAVCEWAAEGQRRVEAAYASGLPAMAELALGLTPAQLRHVERRFEKNNEKFADEFLQGRPEERLRAQVKKAEDRFEMVYGSIDEAQRERLRALLAASPYDPALWLAERKLLQQEVLGTLQRVQAMRGNERAAEQAQAALRAIADHAARSPRPAYRQQQQRVWTHNCALTAQMHNAMSGAQRQHGERRFKRWEDDLRALIAQAR